MSRSPKDVLDRLESYIDELAKRIHEAVDVNPGDFKGINIRRVLKDKIRQAVIDTMSYVIARGNFVDLDEDGNDDYDSTALP